jgi:putative tryptophan/tyrosine transport system substrate-binding protein
MRRRAFIVGLSGSVAWPFVARAQRSRVAILGVIQNLFATDPEGIARTAVLVQRLQELGWTAGRNLQFDFRWSGGDTDHVRRDVAELIAQSPDLILAAGTVAATELRRSTRTIPIVFVQVTDPVGAGLVASLSHPGGNLTGFTFFEYGLSTKWLELLKQVAPSLKRVAVVRDPTTSSAIGTFGAIQGAASSSGIQVAAVDMRDAGEIELALTAFAREPNGGMIVAPGPLSDAVSKMIISLCARLGLPAVFPYRYLAKAGGLISYGPDVLDQYRQTAGYVDRILRGEKPSDLPVQAPTRYETVLNLRTAKALGITVPAAVLTIADEVIE